MPEANYLYATAAVVIVGLVVWVAAALKTAKEPWARAPAGAGSSVAVEEKLVTEEEKAVEAASEEKKEEAKADDEKKEEPKADEKKAEEKKSEGSNPDATADATPVVVPERKADDEEKKDEEKKAEKA